MKDWMVPLNNRKTSNRPSYARNSGSAMVKFELINILNETDQAYLVIIFLGGQNIGRWLPKSQVKIPSADVIEIPRWLVDKILEEMEQWIK